MRKTMYGAFALAAALAVGFGVNAGSALATNITDKSKIAVTTDGKDTLTVTVTDGDATTKILAGVPTLKANPKINGATKSELKAVTVKSWDVYDGVAGTGTATAKIDISKLSKAKETYLMVKADYMKDEDAIAVVIPQSLSLKASYSNKTGIISIEKKDKSVLGASATKLKYYTESGSEGYVEVPASGRDVKSTNFYGADGTTADGEALARYQQSGGTLYFETPADNAAPVQGTSWSVTDKSGTKKVVALAENTNGYKDINTMTLKPRSSARVKCNITKLGNAPKVTVDYVKGTLSFPKGSAGKVVSADATKGTNGDGVLATVTSANTSSKAYVLGIKDNMAGIEDDLVSDTDAAAFAVDIKTPGTSGTKLDSKWGHYVFDKQEVPAALPVNEKVKLVLTYKRGFYSGKVLTTDTKNKYIIGYYDKKNNKRVKVTTSLAKDGALDSGKIVESKAGKANLSNVDITFAAPTTGTGTTATPDTQVTFQIAGDKKEERWVSQEMVLVYDETAPANTTTGYSVDITRTGDPDQEFPVSVKPAASVELDTDGNATDDDVKAAVTFLRGKFDGTVKVKKDVEKEILAAGDWNTKLNSVEITVDNGELTKCSASDGIKVKASEAKGVNLLIAKKPVTFEIDYASTNDAKDSDCIAAYNGLDALLNGTASKPAKYYVGDEIDLNSLKDVLTKVQWGIGTAAGTTSTECDIGTSTTSGNQILKVKKLGEVTIKIAKKPQTP